MGLAEKHGLGAQYEKGRDIMHRIVILAILGTLVWTAGCVQDEAMRVGAGSEPVRLAWEFPIEDVAEEYPDDEYCSPALRPTYNKSREERRQRRAQQILGQMRAALPAKSPDELIGMIWRGMWLRTNGVEYYVARNGNWIIRDELKRRGEEARETLIGFRDAEHDHFIFSGISGPGESIGDMCEELLAELPED